MQIDQIAEYRYPSLVHFLESVLFDNYDIDLDRSYLENAPMRESAS